MNKKNILGLVISVIGLFIMGYSIGKRIATDESNLPITFTGLFIVFIGVFIVMLFNKKK